MVRRKLMIVSVIFFASLSTYIAHSLLTFTPPEILVTEGQAHQIAISHYHEFFEGRYNFTDVHILQAELKDAKPWNPWMPRPTWRVSVGATAIMHGEPYHLCLDVDIDVESGKVLRSITLP